MAKILQLDQTNYDLWISYTWSNNNHGICGHTFELIDYYFFLKDFFRVGVLLAEDIDWETFEKSIVEKYEVSKEELLELKKHTVICNRPSLVRGNNILFTDGGVRSLSHVTLFFNKIIHFACGDFEIKDNENSSVYILQDERVYAPVKVNGIHYIKKILFSRYKKINSSSCEDNLLYGTKNCRNIPREMYLDLLNKYSGSFFCLTNKENKPEFESARINFVEMPVENLFEKFGTYIYTPVPRKFDCSPRFITECRFYGKKVEYYNIDYWEEDKGLYWRKYDIDNNFDSLFLTKDDDLPKILKGII